MNTTHKIVKSLTESNAEKYISHNPYITRTNIKLLGAG